MELSSTAGEFHEHDSCASESIGLLHVIGARDKQSSISAYQLGLCMKITGTVSNHSGLTGEEISALKECYEAGLVPENMKVRVQDFLVKRKALRQ